MDLPLAMAVVLAVAATFVIKQLLSFFSKLDQESSQGLLLQLEDPNSVKPLQCPSIWSEATKNLSVVIPAYNEEDRLPATLDETLSVAMGYVKQQGIDAVRLLRLPYNCGKGRAVREGMLIARGQVCLFMDADGATRVSDMELLEAGLKEVAVASWGGRKSVSIAAGARPADSGGPLAVAVGSRAHLEQSALAKRTWLRNFLMHGFHFLVTFVAGHDVKDTQCGFKMFTRRAAATVYTNQRLQRWCFDVELIYLSRRLGVPIKEVQVILRLAVHAHQNPLHKDA
eukprot:gene2221-2534_t